MFWVDEIVEDIIKKKSKENFKITDWMTTSGHAHIGSLRGVIVHDLIRRGLSERDKDAEFQWGFDDFDPMDGLPKYVDQSFIKYMGIPLCNIPAPDGKSQSFAKQYADEFIEIMDGMGVKAKIVNNSEIYKKGEYNEAIKIVLDNAEIIRKIYKEISGSDKGTDWYPFQVICPNCGKIGTTKVTNWDGKEVDYVCEESLVEWAKGCGQKGRMSPFDGNGKMPWKVEWPSKWFITKTDIEGEGKDHFAAGGSRDIANRIFKEVFKKEPPYDIRYEHFLIGGMKMSSSKGLGVTAIDMFKFLPANLLRFIFVRTKYKRAIEFNPEGDAVSLLYDEYDRCAEIYEKDKNSDLGRAFYYTERDSSKLIPQYKLRFSKIAYMLQMPRVDIFEYASNEKARLLTPERSDGGQGSELSESEKKEIENRIEIAKVWLEKFAPENFKFKVLDSLPKVELNDSQKKFLAKVLETFESKESWSGEDLHKEIHNIKKELNIDPRGAFSSVYQIFIGKDSGPQAGWFLASLDKNMVKNRLREAINA